MESKGSGLAAKARSSASETSGQFRELSPAKAPGNAPRLILDALAASAESPTGVENELFRVCGELLDRFIPSGILLDRRRHIVQTFAGADQYVTSPQDGRDTDIGSLAEGELKDVVTKGVERASREHAPVSFHGVRISTIRGEVELAVHVTPLGTKTSTPPFLFIIFEETPKSSEDDAQAAAETRVHARLLALEDGINQRDQFLAVLSHELRNPLGALVNATHILDRHCQTSQICQSPCDVIHRQSQQMARLIDDLQDVSRIVQGKISIRRIPFDIRKAIESALEVVGPRFSGRAHKLHLAVDPVPLWINGDCSRVQQILVNLLVNATKYTPSGGEIWVSAIRETDHIVLRVRDTGDGIPKNMLDRVFELFVQAEPARRDTEQGMGVGLALVKKLVDLHEGEVTAFSDGPGSGSEFVVRFRVCPPDQLREGPAQQESAAAQSGRVLVVEDDDDSREMLATLLELDGYSVVLAADGRQALEALDQGVFDIALVDIGLPEVDGYQVANRVRLDARHKEMRLVALTGYGQLSDRSAVKAAGFDAHLVKPLDHRELSRLLQRSSGR